ncbi:MAG: hypothetical protein EA351_14295 [Gemmatimonadales bacterium]|nr:MAG: hypothetical protein EA351_14295 [Gemmatimonadales bacterium]
MAVRPSRGAPAGIALEWWLAGGLLVVVQAGLIAALFTPAPHPGGDNFGYLTLGYALSQGLGYTELWAPGTPPHTKYPPVFSGLLALLILGGAASWGAFKVVMGVLVSLAGILVFVWAGGRRGALAGLTVALLTLLSAGWLEASRWILSEPLFLVFAVLTLWAGDRALATGSDSAESGGSGWIVVAAVAAILAFFTRSAGLPLVLALVGALFLARRWKTGALVGGGAALLGGLWFLRVRGDAEGAYQSEFWMANPYDPALGTIGPLGLIGRAVSNLVTYTGRVIPGEWWGNAGGLLVALGLVLVGLALVGWILRLRRSIGVAELFLPLYAGLILIWPEVWAGDRFVLVLYPILLLYAGEAVVWLTSRSDRVWLPVATVALGALLLGGPAVPGALEKVDRASACRTVGAADPFRCLGGPMMEFREAAAWAGEHLPEGAIVLNRKPRIFHALGGTVGRTFPFTRDPDAFLREADEIGAEYLLVDAVDGISIRYLPPLLREAPGAFCWVVGWGEVTDLLGILPPAERGGSEILECPPEFGPVGVGPAPVGDRHRIPLLR